MSEHVLLIAAAACRRLPPASSLVWFFWLRPVKEEAAVGYEADRLRRDRGLAAKTTRPLPSRPCSAPAAGPRPRARLALRRCAGAGREGHSGSRGSAAFFETHYTPYRVLNATCPARSPAITSRGRGLAHEKRQISGAGLCAARRSRSAHAGRDAGAEQRQGDGHAQDRGRRSCPTTPAQEIEQGALKGRELEILYLADPVELFFMQVQGSGRVRLPDGSKVQARLCRQERAFLHLDRQGAGRARRGLAANRCRCRASRNGCAPTRSAASD